MRNFNQPAYRHPSNLLAGVAAVSVGAVAAALVSQHVFGMEPCPWCVLQRLIFLAIAATCLVGLLWRQRVGHQLTGLVVVGLAISGIGSALWQHFYAAANASCNLTLADRIVTATKLDMWAPDVFSARASCADAAVNLAGMPYEFWSLVLYIGITFAGLRLLRHDA